MWVSGRLLKLSQYLNLRGQVWRPPCLKQGPRDDRTYRRREAARGPRSPEVLGCPPESDRNTWAGTWG